MPYAPLPLNRRRLHVTWRQSRYGWDALLTDPNGHVLDRLDYGLPQPPTPRQQRAAERRLLPH